ncbi:MAG TPA: hypothetical protein VFU32_04015 [Ktedonobacterales bacterium]|nr:hypothetical protein [Ktedonobacterales bacterium]
MNRVTNVVRMHLKGWQFWFLAPWSIVLSSFVINLIIASFVGGKAAIYTGGLSSIYIYILVLGGIVVKDTFSFALGFSVRRRDYYLGTLLMAAGVSAISAVLIWLLSIVENSLVPGWGLNLHFFHLPYLNDGSLAEQLWIYFVVMLCMFLLGFMPGTVFQRYRSYGLYSLTAVVLLPATILGFVATRYSWWGTIFGWFAQQSAFDLASWTVLIVAICVLSSYAFLRKAAA